MLSSIHVQLVDDLRDEYPVFFLDKHHNKQNKARKLVEFWKNNEFNLLDIYLLDKNWFEYNMYMQCKTVLTNYILLILKLYGICDIPIHMYS